MPQVHGPGRRAGGGIGPPGKSAVRLMRSDCGGWGAGVQGEIEPTGRNSGRLLGRSGFREQNFYFKVFFFFFIWLHLTARGVLVP